MCVRLCLASILFHFSILKNLSTNTTCHSDLLVIILNQKKIFTAFTCRAIPHYLVSAHCNPNFLPWHVLTSILILISGNLHPHSLCRGHSGLLSVPWTCCTWFSYQGPRTRSARQSVWLPYLPMFNV